VLAVHLALVVESNMVCQRAHVRLKQCITVTLAVVELHLSEGSWSFTRNFIEYKFLKNSIAT